jgi:hypothetical protein
MVAAGSMTEVDRSNVLQDLDRRHTDVLGELEALEQRVEAVLATLRPPAAASLSPQAATAADPAGPTY